MAPITTLFYLVALFFSFTYVSQVESAPAHYYPGLPVFEHFRRDPSSLESPRFVLYTDRYIPDSTGPPSISEVEGFNVVVLSFLLLEGPYDKAEEWARLSPAERSAIKSQYAAAGIKLIVSAFGSSDVPTSSGADPIKTADTMAAWVKQYDLDGIDVDYEDLNAITAGDGKAEAWLTAFTQQLRVHLPQNQYILTHAPVAPWFSPGRWGGGAYLTVDKNVGDLIDWYNVQYYNQGFTEYITCQDMLTSSSNAWPKTALFQIAELGVPLNKLIIGKPAVIVADASNGSMDPVTLSFCLQEGKQRGWSGGVMAWQFPDASASWIRIVRSQSWPE